MLLLSPNWGKEMATVDWGAINLNFTVLAVDIVAIYSDTRNVCSYN